MSWMERIKRAVRAAKDTDGNDIPAGVLPPSRDAAGVDPLTLSTVFRGVQILQTAIAGLPVYELHAGYREPVSAKLLTRPDPARSRRDFISDIVMSLVTDGNAFVRLNRFGAEIVSCEVVPPAMVQVVRLNDDPAAPILRYDYLGRRYRPDDMVHMRFLNVPGELRGRGPITAAAAELRSAAAARDAKAKYYQDSSNVKMVMVSTQPMSEAAAKEAKAMWEAQGDAGGTKFIGNGYELKWPTFKAEDLQFLSSQKFDTTQIARLLGIPASIMLAAVEGSNLTYSNLEQEWIEFADFTLSSYTGEIEELFDRLLPSGRTARFDWDSFRRTDMSSKIATLSAGIGSGIYTADEARAMLGLRPLTDKEDA